jgi:hypothetical protein
MKLSLKVRNLPRLEADQGLVWALVWTLGLGVCSEVWGMTCHEASWLKDVRAHSRLPGSGRTTEY